MRPTLGYLNRGFRPLSAHHLDLSKPSVLLLQYKSGGFWRQVKLEQAEALQGADLSALFCCFHMTRGVCLPV